MSAADIVVILPPREGFSPQHFGAISLCVADFTRYSRFRHRTLVLGGIEGPSFDQIPFHYVSGRCFWFQSHTRAYARNCLAVIKEKRPRLVEIHNRPCIFQDLARQWTGPLALHLHNDPQEMRGCKTVAERKQILARAAAIYCVSQYIRDRFCEGLNEPLEKVQVVYNGLEPAFYDAPKEKKLVFVGRIKPEKGALEFAQSLAEILPHYPDWRGVFIGAARHDPKAKITEYERRVMQTLQPVDDRVDFRGFCAHIQVMEELASAEIAVVPSQWNEAFGRTALEAMATGSAVISTPFGGLKEVVGDAAYVLSSGASAELSTAMRTLIENIDLRKQLQQKAPQQASHFDIRHCTAALDNIRSAVLHHP